MAKATPAELQKVISADAAVVDFVNYARRWNALDDAHRMPALASEN